MTTAFAAGPGGSGPLAAALAAVEAGTATTQQQDLVAEMEHLLSNPTAYRVVGAVRHAVGNLADVMEAPWSDLNEVQKWIRDQAAAAEQSRTSPALADMSTVYDLLVAAGNNAGPRLKMSPGCNILALDEHRRRFLIPHVVDHAIDRIRKSASVEDARAAAATQGAVRFHWSSKSTGLVPDPDKVRDLLPVKKGGSYLMIYAHSVDVLSKKSFVDATSRLVKALPFLDVLMWDTAAAPSTLWTLRGQFGHQAGDDVDFPQELEGAARTIRNALRD